MYIQFYKYVYAHINTLNIDTQRNNDNVSKEFLMYIFHVCVWRYIYNKYT